MEIAMEAFVCILIAATWASPLSAQDSTRVIVDSALTPATHPYRDPHRALIFGTLIPGAGHIYAGEYWHGIINYETTVMTIGAGAMVFIVDKCTFSFFSAARCNAGPQWPHQALGVVTVGLGFWQWISSARDAQRAAERANAKHQRKAAAAKPIIEAPVGSHGDWRVGVAIPW
jgi:hypothetical protein